jgi:hypothetical protein
VKLNRRGKEQALVGHEFGGQPAPSACIRDLLTKP